MGFLNRPIRVNKSKLFTIILMVFVGLFVMGFFVNDYQSHINLPEIDYEALNEQEEEAVPVHRTGPTIAEQENKLMILQSPDTASREKKEVILIAGVPFTPQAPLAEWEDSRQQDGCEEASALMAVYWARGKTLTAKTAKEQILKMADYQEKKYGSYIDTSAIDTAERLIAGYFGYKNVKVVYDMGIERMVDELEKGNIIIVPTNGQKLYNPFYNPPGPERHNLLLKGFDYNTDEFITNDPGTKRGEDYRYSQKILYNAIVDYPTGDHEPIIEVRKAMIVVGK